MWLICTHLFEPNLVLSFDQIIFIYPGNSFLSLERTLGTASKPNRRLTGGFVRFHPVSIVPNKDNRPEPDGTAGLPAVGFWSRPLGVFTLAWVLLGSVSCTITGSISNYNMFLETVVCFVIMLFVNMCHYWIKDRSLSLCKAWHPKQNGG